MDWFVVHAGAKMVGVDRIAIDLRSVHACASNGVCGSVDMSKLKGMYPTLSTVTLWSSLGFGALVLIQAGSRLIAGAASEAVSKRGYAVGIAAIVVAGATAYFFGPEIGAIQDTPF